MEHKVLETIKKRSITFTMVLAVVLAAAGIVIISSAVRETSCQARADELLMPILLASPSDNKTVFDATLAALKQLDLNVRFKKENKTVKEITVLDAGGRLSSHGYRLVRELSAGVATWALRYISTQLCDTVPPISMDVASNSDYETESRRVIATLPNETRFFVRESTLSSHSADRIRDFDDFQSCFPGFRKRFGSGPWGQWDRPDSFLVETVSTRPVVNSNGGNVFHLSMESWAQTGRSLFWKITVRCTNPAAQDLAVAAFAVLKAEYESRGLLYFGLGSSDMMEWCGVA
jgi:hypothetical protein